MRLYGKGLCSFVRVPCDPSQPHAAPVPGFLSTSGTAASGFLPVASQHPTGMPLPCPAPQPLVCSLPTEATSRLYPTAIAPPGCSFMAPVHHHMAPPRAMAPQPPPPAAPQSMVPTNTVSSPPYARHPSMCLPSPSSVFVHSPYAIPAVALEGSAYPCNTQAPQVNPTHSDQAHPFLLNSFPMLTGTGYR